MSKRRQRWKAICTDLTKTVDGRPTAPKISREQWVIECVSRAVGTRRNLVTADDVASDIIMELFDAGGFNWPQEEIEEFCRKKTASLALRCLRRRETPECEFKTAENSGKAFNLIADMLGTVPARQELAYEAKEALGLLKAIPDRQRWAIEILCGGGNPVDVAEDLGITPWEAITLIKEGRDYVHRVDPE